MKRNTIYISIVVLVICAIATMPLVKIPVSTSSRGIVRPVSENTKIVSVVSGRIIKSNLKFNNQEVSAGDTLLVITSEHLGAKKQLQDGLNSDYSAQLSDLSKLVNGNFENLSTGQYQKEVATLRERVEELNAQLELAEKDLSRSKVLFDQGVIPQAEYDKTFFTFKNAKSKISAIQEEQMAQWQAQKREVQRQLTTVNSDISQIKIEGENYIVRSPVAGRLVNLSGVQEGNFLIQGQNVVEISADSNLIAECSVAPNDIGLIKKGQKVRFQIDTYNYNQWGTIEGIVDDIDQNIVTMENGQSFFKVRCSMDKNYLQLKNGYKGEVQKGSTYTARFYLLDRTLWQLLFDRVDDWFNPNLI
ncbi:HlyD family secretion protein [Sphingobacterium sp. LRF_L2]|uniref:HlyD family secretion protein n=1 Tax=Sphingobacterium sp. LRF_L2 TaxID=3369421 RepID=UPI003F5F01F8